MQAMAWSDAALKGHPTEQLAAASGKLPALFDSILQKVVLQSAWSYKSGTFQIRGGHDSGPSTIPKMLKQIIGYALRKPDLLMVHRLQLADLKKQQKHDGWEPQVEQLHAKLKEDAQRQQDAIKATKQRRAAGQSSSSSSSSSIDDDDEEEEVADTNSCCDDDDDDVAANCCCCRLCSASLQQASSFRTGALSRVLNAGTAARKRGLERLREHRAKPTTGGTNRFPEPMTGERMYCDAVAALNALQDEGFMQESADVSQTCGPKGLLLHFALAVKARSRVMAQWGEEDAQYKLYALRQLDSILLGV